MTHFNSNNSRQLTYVVFMCPHCQELHLIVEGETIYEEKLEAIRKYGFPMKLDTIEVPEKIGNDAYQADFQQFTEAFGDVADVEELIENIMRRIME